MHSAARERRRAAQVQAAHGRAVRARRAHRTEDQLVERVAAAADVAADQVRVARAADPPGPARGAPGSACESPARSARPAPPCAPRDAPARLAQSSDCGPCVYAHAVCLPAGAREGSASDCWPTSMNGRSGSPSAKRRALQHLRRGAADVHRARFARPARDPRDRPARAPSRASASPDPAGSDAARRVARAAAHRPRVVTSAPGHHIRDHDRRANGLAPIDLDTSDAAAPQPRSASPSRPCAPRRPARAGRRSAPRSGARRHPPGSASRRRAPAASDTPPRSRCPRAVNGASECIAEPYSHAREPSSSNSRSPSACAGVASSRAKPSTRAWPERRPPGAPGRRRAGSPTASSRAARRNRA